jgi:hypothetical protein
VLWFRCVFLLPELALSDWACGIRAAYCVDAPLMDIIDPFRSIISELISQYCRNASACLLKKTFVVASKISILPSGFQCSIYRRPYRHTWRISETSIRSRPVAIYCRPTTRSHTERSTTKTTTCKIDHFG